MKETLDLSFDRFLLMMNVEEHIFEVEDFELWSAFAEFNPLCSAADGYRTKALMDLIQH